MENVATISFSIPENGLIKVPGFLAYYDASDIFESKFYEIGEEKKNPDITNLFFLRETKSIILQPNILPIDMTGKDIEYYDYYKKEKYIIHRGDNYDCIGGKWQLMQVVGNPSAMCEFQSVVLENDKVVSWYVMDGNKRGKYGTGSACEENQGFVVWIGKNILPLNEKQVIEFFLKIDDEKGDWKEGIYIKIEDGKNVSLAHCKTLRTQYTIPPRNELVVQWEGFTMPEGQKDLFSWPQVDVWAVFFVDDHIVISKNGISNYKAIKCLNYDIGRDVNGKEYPIIVNDGANFWIEGKGQCLLGWKRMMYDKEGTLETKLVFPGYKLNNPKIAITEKNIFEGTSIEGKGYCGGYKKLGGIIQVGPIANIDWEKGAYGQVSLKAEQIDASGQNQYLSSVSYYTPVLKSFVLKDDRQRITSTATAPDAITGDITSIDISYSASESDLTFRDNSADVEMECTRNRQTYIDLLERQILYGKAEVNGTSLGYYIFNRLTLSDNEYKETRFRLEGDSIFGRLSEMNLSHLVYLEGYTHTDAMKKLCNLAGVDCDCSDDASLILTGEKEKYLFQSGTSVASAMEKIRKLSGWLLYPGRDGKIKYRPIGDTPAITFTKATDAVANVEYRSSDTIRTRMKILGKAGKDSYEFFKGDTLAGYILHRTKENQIGFDMVYEETDDSLSDWVQIQKRLEHLDRCLNKQSYSLSFTITDATDYLWLNLYDIFLWIDETNSIFNNKKFVIVHLSFSGNATQITAQITGKML